MAHKSPRRPLVFQWLNTIKIKLVNKSVTVEFLSSDDDEFGICIKRMLTKEEISEQNEKPLIGATSKVEKGRILKSTVKISREGLEALHYATWVALSKLKKTPK